ncbi:MULTISPECIES: hypothetical protein [unclassified Pseudomonas]|uniref:hypothetical protein n=1 Tax=Pseudomonas TaxID=286 RepID=UPI000A1D5A65|nr:MULTISPECIES: hypothetical protein [unclassified Pseudomonas]
MANNLFISYDLRSPGQSYSRVIEAIKSLGPWAKVQESVWYVNAALTAEFAAKHVRAEMDENDRLIVVDASNNDAYWFNLTESVAKHMQNNWNH